MTMARKTSRAASPIAVGEADAAETKVTKTAAVKAALAEGVDSPEEGVDFIRKRFGIEMGRQHFSATKSQLKRKEAAAPQDGRKARGARQAPEASPQVAPATPSPANGEPDLIESLETLKPLIASYGAEKVKRLVDLLG
jgi:hypothetical protein